MEHRLSFDGIMMLNENNMDAYFNYRILHLNAVKMLILITRSLNCVVFHHWNVIWMI